MKHSRFNRSPRIDHRARKVHVASVAMCSTEITKRKSMTYADFYSEYPSSIQVTSCSIDITLFDTRISIVANITNLKHGSNVKAADSQDNGFMLPNATDATHLHLAALIKVQSRIKDSVAIEIYSIVK